MFGSSQKGKISKISFPGLPLRKFHFFAFKYLKVGLAACWIIFHWMQLVDRNKTKLIFASFSCAWQKLVFWGERFFIRFCVFVFIRICILRRQMVGILVPSGVTRARWETCLESLKQRQNYQRTITGNSLLKFGSLMSKESLNLSLHKVAFLGWLNMMSFVSVLQRIYFFCTNPRSTIKAHPKLLFPNS